MKKNMYIVPALHTVQLSAADGLLLGASDGTGANLFEENSKGTSDSGFTGQEVKSSGFNVWNDDWSR